MAAEGGEEEEEEEPEVASVIVGSAAFAGNADESPSPLTSATAGGVGVGVETLVAAAAAAAEASSTAGVIIAPVFKSMRFPSLSFIVATFLARPVMTAGTNADADADAESAGDDEPPELLTNSPPDGCIPMLVPEAETP